MWRIEPVKTWAESNQLNLVSWLGDWRRGWGRWGQGRRWQERWDRERGIEGGSRGVTGRERASVGLRRRLVHQLSLPSLCMVQCLSPLYVCHTLHCMVQLQQLSHLFLVQLPSLCMVHNSPTTSTPVLSPMTLAHSYYPLHLHPIFSRDSTISLSQYYLTLLLQFFSIQPSSHASYYLFPALYHRDHFFLFLIQTKKVETWGDLLFPVSYPN